MTHSLSPRFIAINTAFFALAMAVAAVQWWPVYQDTTFILMASVVLVVGSAIAIVGAVRRWSTAVVTVCGLAAFLLLGVPLAVPSAAFATVLPSLEGLRQLLAATALGWKQLLTITLPVGSYQALLVPAFVVFLLCTIAGLTIALRAKAGDLAVLSPIVIMVSGIAIGPTTARWPLVLALALLAISLGWIVWRRWQLRRAAIGRLTAATTDVGGAPAVPGEPRIVGLRMVVSATLIMAVAAASAVAATTLLPPGGSRSVLRTVVVQPFDPRDYASPLAAFRHYLQPGTAESTIFTVSGLPDGAFLRVATLDSYDGVVYAVGSDTVDSASGSFTRVPYRFDQSDVSGDPVTLRVRVGAYDGVWLPTIGQLERVTFDGTDAAELQDAFYYNDTSGTAAVIGGLALGDEYSLDAVVPHQPSADALATVTPGAADVPAIGVLPAELDLALTEWTGEVTGQGNKLVAMLEGFAENGYISHGIAADEPLSRSGHAADRITQLLTDQRMIGDAEQYSVAASLMARELGFPARVVFGFDTSTDDSAGNATSEVDVTGASVTARIEVNTAEYGWVSIDPSPEVRPIPDEVPEDPAVVSRPPAIIQPPVDDPESREQQTPPESTQQDPEVLSPLLAILLVVLRVVGWAALGAAILLSPFIVIIAAKLRRRRARRRAPTPVQRISGGWSEFRDSAIDHGIDLPPSATRSQVAAAVGGVGPVVLATLSDRAIFSPGDPDAADADRIWKAVTDLRRGLGAGRTRWQKITALVSLRSLRRGGRTQQRARRGRDE